LQSDLAYYESRIGDMHVRLGNFTDAHDRFSKALQIAEGCVQQNPQGWQAAVPRYMAKVAGALAGLDVPDLPESLHKFDSALKLQEALTSGPEANNAILSNLALSHLGKGKALMKTPIFANTPAWDLAISEFKRAIEIHQRLVALDQANATWLSYLALEQQGLVDAYLGTNGTSLASEPDFKNAAAALQDELATREKLFLIDKSSKNLADDLAKTRDDLVYAQAQSGDPAKQVAPKN
jgi:tetratricopeptide (TPR) repeat protein